MGNFPTYVAKPLELSACSMLYNLSNTRRGDHPFKYSFKRFHACMCKGEPVYSPRADTRVSPYGIPENVWSGTYLLSAYVTNPLYKLDFLRILVGFPIECGMSEAFKFCIRQRHIKSVQVILKLTYLTYAQNRDDTYRL